MTSHRTIYRPAASQPTLDSPDWYSEMALPLRDGHGATSVVNKARCSFVRRLLPCSGPAHVARLVVSIAVDAIDRMRLCWSSSDVIQERFKRGRPFSAHGDTATAIGRIGNTVWIGASFLRRAPSVIFTAVAHAVRAVGVASALFPETPTAFSRACLELIANDVYQRSADTSTSPSRVSYIGLLGRSAFDGQSVERLTIQILNIATTCASSHASIMHRIVTIGLP